MQHTIKSPITNNREMTTHVILTTANVTQKDTRLLLVLIDNEKIGKALRNGLRSNLFQIETTPVVDFGIRNAFLQLLAEFVRSLNTTVSNSSLLSTNQQASRPL